MELTDEAISNIVAHLAHLRAEYGEVLSEPELVEPNGEYFPDAFAVEPKAIAQLMQRMTTYAPLSEELSVELAFVEPDEAQGGGGCSSGACGPGGGATAKMLGGAVETPEGYAVVVSTSDVGEPKLLTASIARALGRIVLFEADEDVDARVEGALSELTAVACGLGTILFNASAIYKKGCGGVRMHQGTFLGVHELALANALFVRATEERAGRVRKHLAVTQREAFDEALSWVDARPKLVSSLRETPELLVDGILPVEEKKGFFGRILSSSAKPAPEDEMPISRPAKVRSEAELRRLAEAKALVEEAFES